MGLGSRVIDGVDEGGDKHGGVGVGLLNSRTRDSGASRVCTLTVGGNQGVGGEALVQGT